MKLWPDGTIASIDEQALEMLGAGGKFPRPSLAAGRKVTDLAFFNSTETGSGFLADAPLVFSSDIITLGGQRRSIRQRFCPVPVDCSEPQPIEMRLSDITGAHFMQRLWRALTGILKLTRLVNSSPGLGDSTQEFGNRLKEELKGLAGCHDSFFFSPHGQWPGCIQDLDGKNGLVCAAWRRERCLSCGALGASPENASRILMNLGLGMNRQGLFCLALEPQLGQDEDILAALEDLARAAAEKMRSLGVVARARLLDGQERGILLSTLETTADAVIIFSLSDRRILDVNAEFESLLGYKRSEVVGSRGRDIRLWLDPEAKRDFMRRLLDTGKRLDLETAMRTRAGGQIDVLASGRVVWYKGRECVLCNIRDISCFRRALKGLVRSEQLHRLLVDNIMEVVAVVQAGRCVYFNENLLELTGRSAAEIESIAALDLVHPQDRALVPKALGAAWAHRPAQNLDIRVLDRNENGIWVRVNMVSFDWGGRQALLVMANDINETKRTAHELTAAEEKYKILVDNLAEAIAISQRGRFRFFNDKLSQITGYSSAELYQMCPRDLLHPDDQKRLESAGKRARTTVGFAGAIDLRLVRKTGDLVWVRMNAVRVNWAGASALLSFSRDITSRKISEKQLKESERKYRLVVENAAEGIVIVTWDKGVSPGYDCRYFNDQLAELVGFSRQDVELSRLEDFIHPDDMARLYAMVRQAYGEGRSARGQLRIIDKKARVRWLSMIMVGIKYEGQDGLLAFMHDITEENEARQALALSEEKYRNLADSLPEAIFEVGVDGDFIYLNKTGLELLGIGEDQLAKGLNLRHIVKPELVERARQVLKKGLDTGEYAPGEFVLTGADNKRYTVVVRLVPIYERDRVSGFRGVAFDVTEAKRAEAERLRMENQLRQAQKMEAVGTLAGGISHDFNNILQAILGYADLLMLKGDQPRAVDKAAREISQAAKKGGELARRLLTFSAKLESEPVPLDLNRELRQVMKLVRRSVPPNIKIKLNLAEDLKVIDADSSQTQQVIMNLALNAADAMAHGGMMEIRTNNHTVDAHPGGHDLELSPGEYIHLCVRDTGQGMDARTMEHIFEPFFTTKEPGKGTGLGMAMVYGIVSQHKGVIRIDSEPGKGSAFHVFFPAARHGQRPSRVAGPVLSPGVGGETILLVDDEASIRELGQEVIASFGYQVLTAASAEEALKIFEDHGPGIDLVILDLVMPGMDGRSCLGRLKAVQPGVKVLLSSGHVPGDSHKLAAELEAKGFIRKPYDISQLLKIIREIVESAI